MGLYYAKWTKDHKRMMKHIGLAIAAGCSVQVTFRKPNPDEAFANAVEIGEVSITGIIPARKRK